MGIAIRISQTGGPDVLKVESITDAPPGPGEVWIEQEAIGVNYLDVTQRNGSVPIPLPSGLGFEAAVWPPSVPTSRTSRSAIASPISWDRSAATPALVFIRPNVLSAYPTN